MAHSSQRLASGVLAGAGLLVLLASGETDALVAVGGALLLGMIVVWYAEAFGSLTGLRFGTQDSASPAPLVRLLGWLFLLAACAGSVRVLLA